MAVIAALDKVEVESDIRQREAGAAGHGVTPMRIRDPWTASYYFFFCIRNSRAPCRPFAVMDIILRLPTLF